MTPCINLLKRKSKFRISQPWIKNKEGKTLNKVLDKKFQLIKFQKLKLKITWARYFKSS